MGVFVLIQGRKPNMPLLSVDCNVPTPDNITGVLKAFSSKLAEVTGKPEKWMMVQYNHKPSYIMGGSSDPCAVVTFSCIGKISKNENAATSQAVCGLLEEHFKVNPERVYIFFNDYPRENVGWNNTTFGHL